MRSYWNGDCLETLHSNGFVLARARLANCTERETDSMPIGRQLAIVSWLTVKTTQNLRVGLHSPPLAPCLIDTAVTFGEDSLDHRRNPSGQAGSNGADEEVTWKSLRSSRQETSAYARRVDRLPPASSVGNLPGSIFPLNAILSQWHEQLDAYFGHPFTNLSISK